MVAPDAHLRHFAYRGVLAIYALAMYLALVAYMHGTPSAACRLDTPAANTTNTTNTTR